MLVYVVLWFMMLFGFVVSSVNCWACTLHTLDALLCLVESWEQLHLYFKDICMTKLMNPLIKHEIWWTSSLSLYITVVLSRVMLAYPHLTQHPGYKYRFLKACTQSSTRLIYTSALLHSPSAMSQTLIGQWHFSGSFGVQFFSAVKSDMWVQHLCLQNVAGWTVCLPSLTWHNNKIWPCNVGYQWQRQTLMMMHIFLFLSVQIQFTSLAFDFDDSF